jgi:hypothetical protein
VNGVELQDRRERVDAPITNKQMAAIKRPIVAESLCCGPPRGIGGAMCMVSIQDFYKSCQYGKLVH